MMASNAVARSSAAYRSTKPGGSSSDISCRSAAWPSGAVSAKGPRPGQWYPGWTLFGGTSHRVLIFGTAADTESLAWLDRRWSILVQISHNPSVDPVRAGLPAGGIAVIRPDGHISFRFPCANAGAFAALDGHLCSYLIPEQAVGPV